MAHINALPRVHHEGKRNFMRFLVHFRNRIDVGKSIAVVTEAVANTFGRLGQFLARESVARLHRNQLAHFGMRQDFFGTRELDAGDLVFRSLRDVDGDVNVFLVRRDRNLGGIDMEFEITCIQIM